MRTFEIILLLATLLAVLTPWISPNRMVAIASAASAIVLAVVQAEVEGSRWQLYGIYALLVVLVAVRYTRRWIEERRSVAQLPLVAGLGVTGLSALLVWALPVPTLPAPAGAFAVGTTSWTVVDSDRIEVYDDSGSARRLVAQAWYPTMDAGDPSPWISDTVAFSREVAPVVALPPFALRHLDQVTTPAILDATLAEGQWPVVVYSHGWGGFRTVQSDYAEYLASNGFVVLALDHTYGASVALFPGVDGGVGESVAVNPDALPDEDVVGEVAYQTGIELLELTFAEDVAELLDQLSAGQGPLIFSNRLQLDRVGLSGHSTGGGAMIRLCLVENRCAGVVGLDPWVEPVPADLRARGMNSPLLSIRSEDWLTRDNEVVLKQFHADSAGSEGLFYIADTVHADFTLQPFLTPLSGLLGSSGPADDRAVHDAVNRAALNFFDRHLRSGEAGVEPSALIIPG